MNADGSNQKQLTHGPDHRPAWWGPTEQGQGEEVSNRVEAGRSVRPALVGDFYTSHSGEALDLGVQWTL